MMQQVQALSLSQAIAAQQDLDISPCPATLHPTYVDADSRRHPGLRPTYLYYESRGERWMHFVHVTDVPGTDWRDASSPYGYGGPLSTTTDPGFLAEAWSVYCGWMQEQRIAVEYIRFHPMLANERYYGGQVSSNREVVWIDVHGPEFTQGYASRLRSTLKKANHSALRYAEFPLTHHAARFAEYYRSAMVGLGADDFYLFSPEYFDVLGTTSMAKLALCLAPDASNDSWLSASVLLESSDTLEYHLAATSAEGKRVGASSYLLDPAAHQARQQGKKAFYLGGGTDQSTDNRLLFYKSSFSNLRLVYWVGYTIFIPRGYEQLKSVFPLEWQEHPERPIFYRKA
jgi:hypothetical protein